MEAKEIILSGKRLFYRTAGAGPVVLLLHGFAEDGNVWSNQFSAFPDFRLIIPDLPGSGASEQIDDMSMEGLAESIYQMLRLEVPEILQAESAQKITMIGHSMGGYVALAYAEKYARTLQGFGLFHSTAFADTEEKKQTRRKGIDFIQRHGAGEFLSSTTPNLYSELTRSHNKGIIDQQIEETRNFSPTALVLYYEAMIRRRDRTDIIKNTNLPVLFVTGKYDQAVPFDDTLKQCHLPDFSYIYMLADSAHMGMQEQPYESVEVLTNYLRSIYYRAR